MAPNIKASFLRFVGHPITKRATAVLEFWTLQRVDTTEKYLKTLDYIASYVGFAWFLGVFLAKAQLATSFKGGIFNFDNWISFVQETALPCILILLFGIVYAFSRHSVRLELLIGPKLFPHDRIPKNWGGSTERKIVFFTVMGFLILYVLLTWFADYIRVASLIMLILACNDWRTRYLIDRGIGNYFKDEAYAPRPDEKDFLVIQRRRAIASKFLFEKPHLWKETARIVGCGLSFLIAMIGYFYSVEWLDFAAYSILILTLVINEVITMRWRFEMYQELKDML